MKNTIYPWEKSFYDPDLMDCGSGNADNNDIINTYQQLLERVQDTVLELGPGTGRIYIPLLESGIKMFGIDSSQKMLNTLENKIQKQPKYKSNSKLWCAEVTQLMNIFEPGQFGAVIATDDFLTHFLDHRILLDCLRDTFTVLKSGGIFITDFRGRNNKRLQSAKGPYPKKTYVYPIVGPCAIDDKDFFIVMTEHENFDETSSSIVSHQRFEYLDSTGTIVKQEYRTIRQRLYSNQEIQSLSQEVGFKLEKIIRRDGKSGPANISSGSIHVFIK